MHILHFHQKTVIKELASVGDSSSLSASSFAPGIFPHFQKIFTYNSVKNNFKMLTVFQVIISIHI